MNDPTPEQLLKAWEGVEVKRSEILKTADFRRNVSFRLFNGTKGTDTLENLVLHLVNHSTYHRGQLATILRQLGKQPPPTDLLIYLQEHNKTT